MTWQDVALLVLVVDAVLRAGWSAYAGAKAVREKAADDARMEGILDACAADQEAKRAAAEPDPSVPPIEQAKSTRNGPWLFNLASERAKRPS